MKGLTVSARAMDLLTSPVGHHGDPQARGENALRVGINCQSGGERNGTVVRENTKVRSSALLPVCQASS